MTEKEKMFAGQWYDANFDEALRAERAKAKDLCFQFNHTRPMDLKSQQRILSELLPQVEVGRVEILAPFMVDYGYNIKIGAGSFFNHNCYLMDCAAITFGEHCFVGPDCGFYTATHPLIAEKRNAGLERALPIEIGNDVWLGGGVRVMPGVKIGTGSVIGAGSIVTKDIPEGVIAVGNPCRVIRPVIDQSIRV